MREQSKSIIVNPISSLRDIVHGKDCTAKGFGLAKRPRVAIVSTVLISLLYLDRVYLITEQDHTPLQYSWILCPLSNATRLTEVAGTSRYIY
jgi:hypothetical protein